MVAIPLIALIFCHTLTLKAVREINKRHNAISSHQRRDNAMATLFFIIILFFIVCHSGKFVLNLYEVYTIFADKDNLEWPLWAFVLTRVNHLLLVFNSSINFFIYCFRDAKFRSELILLLNLGPLLRLLHQGKSSTTTTATHYEMEPLTNESRRMKLEPRTCL